MLVILGAFGLAPPKFQKLGKFRENKKKQNSPVDKLVQKIKTKLGVGGKNGTTQDRPKHTSA